MSPTWIIVIVVVGLLLVGGLLTWMVIWLRRDYQADEARFLARLHEEIPRRGWSFTERDDRATEVFNEVQRYPELTPLVLGYDRRPEATEAHDVLTGRHRGWPFFAAKFYVKDPMDSRGPGTAGYRHVIWVRTPVPRPTLHVRRVTRVASAVNQGLGLGDVRVGHPEFDARYQVTAQDEGFARAVLVPAVVEFLLRDSRDWQGFWIRGTQLDVYDTFAEPRDPDALVPALDLRCDLLDRIPRGVWG